MRTHLLNEFKKVVPDWKTSQIQNTLLMVALLLEEKTVNLWKLKGSVGKLLGNTTTEPRSHYQRLKRWLWLGKANKSIWIGMLYASVSLLKQKGRCLIIDGTSWQWGGKTYHFLTLSVLYQGVSIPIWWHDLAKLGISSQQQRKRMLQLAMKLLNLEGKVLLGDREYIGTSWFEMLHQASIDLVIRLRKGNYQNHIEQQGRSVSKLESKARSTVGQVVWKKFSLQGYDYYYVLKAYRSRSGKIEYLRLISSVSPASAMKYYGYRYRIETMFKHLKSNAFDLESLHVQKTYKIKMMMALVVLAYTLSVCYGLQQYQRRITIKKHGYAEMSVLRYGLDKWQNHLQSFVVFLEYLAQYLGCLLPCEVNQKLLLTQNVP
jgi:hypothetical protein